MDDENKVVSLAGMRDRVSEKEDKNEAKKDEPVYCSFCSRPNTVVAKMIQGPGVNICSECTMVCVQYFILEDKVPSAEMIRVLDSFWSANK